MKICFYHQDFDKDVSSGTVHSAHQWHELCMAFGVSKVAIINETDEKYARVSDSVDIIEYDTLAKFLNLEKGRKVFVETDGETNFKDFQFEKNDWLIFGGYQGLPESDIRIETNGVALYPREAAAIILAEAAWQSH